MEAGDRSGKTVVGRQLQPVGHFPQALGGDCTRCWKEVIVPLVMN